MTSGIMRHALSTHRPSSASLELTLAVKHMEYYMAGLAVLATRTKGTQEILRDGEGGFFYTPGDPDDLASAIARLDQDRELLVKLQRQARALALNGLCWRHEQMRLCELYQRLGDSSLNHHN